MNPSLLNPKWTYIHSSKTDVKKTFARIRKELAKQREQDAAHNRILKVVSR